MPRIVIDQAQRRLPTSTGVAFQQTPQVGAQGTELKRFGEELQAIGSQLDNARRKAETADYISTSQVEVADKLLALRKNMEESFEGNYKGFAKNYLDQADQIYKEYVTNAPNPDAAQRLQLQFSSQRAALGPDMQAYEDRQLTGQYLTNAQMNVNRIANLVVDDPDSAPLLKQQVDAIIEGVDPILSGDKQEQFKQQINRQMAYAMLQGLIFKGDTGRAASVLKSPAISQYLQIDEKKSFENAIKAKDRSLIAEAEEAKKMAIDAKRDELLSLATVGREVAPGQYEPVPTNEIIQNIINSDLPAFGTGSKSQMLKLVEDGQGKEDEVIFNDFLGRIYRGEQVTNDEILSRVGHNGLSYRQFKNLQTERDELGGTTFQEAMKGVKGSITGSNIFGKDPEGDLQYMRLVDEARELYRKALKDKQSGSISYSPDDLFRPGSQQYVLDNLVAKYQRGMLDQIDSMTRQLEKSVNKEIQSPEALKKHYDDIFAEELKGIFE